MYRLDKYSEVSCDAQVRQILKRFPVMHRLGKYSETSCDAQVRQILGGVL